MNTGRIIDKGEIKASVASTETGGSPWSSALLPLVRLLARQSAADHVAHLGSKHRVNEDAQER